MVEWAAIGTFLLSLTKSNTNSSLIYPIIHTFIQGFYLTFPHTLMDTLWVEYLWYMNWKGWDQSAVLVIDGWSALPPYQQLGQIKAGLWERLEMLHRNDLLHWIVWLCLQMFWKTQNNLNLKILKIYIFSILTDILEE